MALDASAVLTSMKSAGENLGNTLWADMKNFALPELEKIATQIVAIESGVLQSPPLYTQAGAQVLLNMQVTASAGIIVGMTALTMIAVQSALNTILSAVRDMVNTAVKFPLIS